MNDDYGTVFPLPLWFVILVFLVCWPSIVFSEPLFQTAVGNTRIVLHSEPCAVEHFEGCWGLAGDGVVMFYFKEDRSVGHAPAKVFERVIGV